MRIEEIDGKISRAIRYREIKYSRMKRIEILKRNKIIVDYFSVFLVIALGKTIKII